MRQMFIFMVVVSTILYAIWFFLPEFAIQIYDYETIGGLQWNGFGASFQIPPPIAYGFAVLYLVAAFGLVSFRVWGRSLFVATTALSLVLILFSGVSAQGSYGAFISTIISLLDGGIIALAFFSSLRNDFNENT